MVFRLNWTCLRNHITYNPKRDRNTDTYAQKECERERQRKKWKIVQAWAHTCTTIAFYCLLPHIAVVFYMLYKYFARKNYNFFFRIVEMLTFFSSTSVEVMPVQMLARSKFLEWAFAFETNSFLTFCLFFLYFTKCTRSLSLSLPLAVKFLHSFSV